MSAAAITLELLGQIEGGPAGLVRAIGRDADGAWYLVEMEPSGERRIMSEAVTPELAEARALAVVAGDSRAITKHTTIVSMAVFIVSLLFMARAGVKPGEPFPEISPDGDERSRAAMPGPTGDDAGLNASGAAPPAGLESPAGGDLFGGR